MKILSFLAGADDENERLDRFLAAKESGLTRSRIEKLSSGGKVLVNGLSRPKNHRLKAGDKIEVTCDENHAEIAVKPKCLTLQVKYEDEDLLVINKEKGMLVHPSKAGEDSTLVNALLYHCGGDLPILGDPARPGIVHRIDRDTSGLLVVAKTDEAYVNLAAQVQAHTMMRSYEGVVHGRLKDASGVIDAPIARHPVHRTKYCVRENGRYAVTRYAALETLRGFTRAAFELETGRTHQIRVHMAHIGHPVAGDPLYGPPKPIKRLRGQCLHAGRLGFIHPRTGEKLEFFAELPRYFVDFLENLKLEEDR